jgi:hypothetical protein
MLFRDLVAQVPQVAVESVLHALLQHFHGCAHSANHAPANNPLCEFQMVKPEQLHAFVKIEHALRYIMQAKEFFMPAIDFIHGEALPGELFLKSFSDSRPDVEQR